MALAAGAGGGAIAWPLLRSSESSRRGPSPIEIVEALRDADPDDLFEKITVLIRSNATSESLLAAAFLLPLLTREPGGDLHASLVIPAIRTTIRPNPEKRLPIMWALENAHLFSSKQRIDAAPLPTRDLEQVLVAASIPRSDPHGAIFAAQALRMRPLLTDLQFEVVLGTVMASLDLMPLLEVSKKHQTQTWDQRADIAISSRLAHQAASGPGLHQVTLFDALRHVWEVAGESARVTIAANASRWLETIHASIVAVHAEPAAQPPAELAGVAATQRALMTSGTFVHDYKFFAAVIESAPRLGNDVRRRWLGLLGPQHVDTETPWPRKDEALRALEAFPV